MSEFEKKLRAKIKSMIPDFCIVGTVTAVDETNYTCNVMPVDNDAEVFKVRLKPTIDDKKEGFIAIPAQDSFVIIGFLKKGDAMPFLIWCSNFTKYFIVGDGGNTFEFKDDGTILVNGDTLGGLIKITDLTTELNNRLNLIKTATLAAFTAVDGSITALGGAAAGASAWNGAIASYSPLNKSAYENDKVKHGSGS
jgi:hypothetical protein